MSRKQDTLPAENDDLSLFDFPETTGGWADSGRYRLLGQVASLEELRHPQEVFGRLLDIDWDFAEENTSYLSHDIHPYPAKFIPQIPSYLVSHLSRPGELVWDPFGGSGTTALETIIMNRRAVSTDANPLGAIIGMAKTTTLTREEERGFDDWGEGLRLLRQNTTTYTETLKKSAANWKSLIPTIPNIEAWFGESVITELAYLRLRFGDLDTEAQRVVARVALSRAVLKVSNQDEETRYARREKDIKPGETIDQFLKELAFCLHRTKELGRLVGFRKAQFATLDVRQDLSSWANLLLPGSVDLIVTSPPYPNVTDYHLYHRFRLFWLGYDPRELAKMEIGSHLRHQKERSGFDHYIEEMKLSLKNMLLALRPGRYVVLVLGDGVFEGVTYATAKNVGSAASELGFEVIGTIDRAVHQTKRSFMVAARRTREEQLLVLRKPLTEMSFTLYPPSYKPWGYEVDLRRREIVALLGKPVENHESGEWTVYTDALQIDMMRKLVFSHAFSATGCAKEATWQAVIENGKSIATARKSSNYITHGIHDYKGKFYPQLAKSVLNIAALPEGARILDPFCGSGTLVLEGLLSGFESFGCDLSPLAVKIARAKTQILAVEPFVRDRLLSQFLDSLTKPNVKEGVGSWLGTYTETARTEIQRWFPQKVLVKIAVVFQTIHKIPHPMVQEFLEVLLSSLVRQISQQDPHDLRIRKRKELIDDAPVIELLSEAVRTQRERLLAFDLVRNFAPSLLGTTLIWEGDSRFMTSYKEKGIQPASVDAVITSPPYATALPYVDTDRLSFLLLFGMSSSERRPLESELTGTREITTGDRKHYDDLIEKRDFGVIESIISRELIREVYERNRNSDVGFRRKNQAALLYKYFSDMTLVLQTVDRLLKPGGQAFFILGDNTTNAGGEWLPITTVKATKDMGKLMGWRSIDDMSISVTVENYRHVKNAITENSILWFRKPSSV